MDHLVRDRLGHIAKGELTGLLGDSRMEDHLEEEIAQLHNSIKSMIQEREKNFHPLWGELMRVGWEKSRFAKQIEEYACLYTGRVTNLRFYSPFKRFTSPRDLMPHDL